MSMIAFEKDSPDITHSNANAEHIKILSTQMSSLWKVNIEDFVINVMLTLSEQVRHAWLDRS